jgi:MFS family permease
VSEGVFGHAVDRSRRDPRRLAALEPVPPRLPRGDRVDIGHQRPAVPEARVRLGEAPVAQEVLATDQPREAGPQALVGGADREATVARAARPIGRAAPVGGPQASGGDGDGRRDVGAHVGEEHRAEGPGHHLGGVEHAKPVERVHARDITIGAEMAFPTGLRALAHRDFRVFWIGQLFSLVGTWMQSVAQAWLVLQLTDSALRLGLIGTLQFAPVLLFSTVAGLIADRLPKRRVILGTQVAFAVQALTLAVLTATGAVQYWHVATLALVYGLVNVLDMPTRQSFLVDLVGRADLMSAVSLNAAAFNTARIVGPAVAGLLIARWGVAPAIFLNGLSFLVVIGALVAVRTPGRPEPAGEASVFAEIAAGVRYVGTNPALVRVLLLLAVVSLCVFNYNVFVPLVAREALHLGAGGFGFLMAMVGVGAVSGALALGALGRRSPPFRLIVLAGAVACGGILGIATVTHVSAAAVLLFVTGFASITFMAACNTSVQLGAPDALRGRVMGLYLTISGGAFPVGAFVTGATAEVAGIRWALVVNGGGGLLTILALTAWWRARRR